MTASEQVPPPGATPTTFGEARLLADADRPGGYLLLVDRVRQSYVDLDDPTYLDFEYTRALGDVLDALPPGPLHVTHVGGGGATLARYIAATRPGSSQIVLEPDTELIAFVRTRLPFGRRSGIRVRAVDGRAGMARLRDGSADVVILDAFQGSRVPAELTTAEFVRDVARVLKRDGLLLINIADGPPLTYTRRLLATLATAFAQRLLMADPAVARGRRFGNVEMVASRAELPVADVTRAAARAIFPLRVVAGEEITVLAGSARPLTDADPARSPAPPGDSWRVAGA